MTQGHRSPWPYAAASFASAFLLFLVQPMIAKAATPEYGGTASVWNSALLVGQVLLLVGSFYAHLLIDRATVTVPRNMHFAVTLAIAAVMLLIPSYIMMRPLPDFATSSLPEIDVPLLMLATVGPAMLLLGAQSPILQRAYSRASGEGNPYPLYISSNAGSLIGLLAYPFVVEPWLATSHQIEIWKILAVVVLVFNALIVLTGPRIAEDDLAKDKRISPAPSKGLASSWALRAFLATAIMMSAGQAISSDIMAMPLIWILPLGAFLIGYMTAFSKKETTNFKRSLKVPQTGLLILAAATANPLIVVNPFVGVLGIIAIGLVTHGLVRGAYETRPDTPHLGKFYLSLSLGGALAGIFVGILSPMFFDWRWELPIVLLGAAALMTPTLATTLSSKKAGVIAKRAMAIIAIGGGLIAMVFQYLDIENTTQSAGVLLVCLAIAIQMTHSPKAFVFWTAWMMLSMGLISQMNRSLEGELRRSYYGVMSVEHTRFDGRPAMVLTHGSTIHGLQMMDRPSEPTSYYTPEGGLGDALRAVSQMKAPKITVAGLGAGTISCLVPRDAQIIFYEIDPEVVRAAQDDFTFLSHCAPDARIEIGDARMKIAAAKAKSDVIILDAFTSDAIPMHLMTAEALDAYVGKLADNGWLLVHVSNRYLDVSSPVASWAKARGYQPMLLDNHITKEGRVSRSAWVAIRPDGWREMEKGWKADSRWHPAIGKGIWTDDRSSITDILKTL